MQIKKLKLSMPTVLGLSMGHMALAVHELPTDSKILNIEFYEHDLDINKKEQGLYLHINSKSFLDVPDADQAQEFEVGVIPSMPKPEEYAYFFASALPIYNEQISKYPDLEHRPQEFQTSIFKTCVTNTVRLFFKKIKEGQPETNPALMGK